MKGREDYRLKGVDGERIETIFLDAEAFEGSLRARVERVGNLERHEVAVAGGRSMEVLAVRDEEAGGFLVRATFDELCRANRGSADYISLCRDAKVIYVSGLRKFERDELDVVRRFITLVDALYDQRVKLIASAEAQPDQLYERGEGAKMFERTASRLDEMQSQDWMELEHLVG